MFYNNNYPLPYVGSTNSIGDRIRHYFKTHHGKVRAILAAIRLHGITSFTLHVIEIPDTLKDLRLLLALEQYYILTTNSDYNILKVANGSPGGMRIALQNSLANSIPIYLYMNGALVYVFDSLNGMTNNAVECMHTTTSTIIECLNTGSTHLSVFTMSRIKPELINQSTLLTPSELEVVVDEARTNYKLT